MAPISTSGVRRIVTQRGDSATGNNRPDGFRAGWGDTVGRSRRGAGNKRNRAGKSIDDVIAWYETEEGPEPYEWVAFWNVMSPGVTSWGELDLPVGAYCVLGFQTHPAADGMAPPVLAVTSEIVVTE